LLAASGLVVQQRAFRRAGLVRFGQDSLWASIAFGWYSLIGQLFAAPSKLPPSNFLNADLFLDVIGFPIQLLRAVTAVFASIYVIRFLRAFQVESDRKIRITGGAYVRNVNVRLELFPGGCRAGIRTPAHCARSSR
jgi:hypothetical protein